MFNKVLIANRGEIAVRVIRTCRDMGIQTVTLYDRSDLGSLHVRLADESVALPSNRGFTDHQAIIDAARKAGVQAIHPGYGFVAEEASFIQACADAGLVFVGPPAEVVAGIKDKIAAQDRAAAAGFAIPRHSQRPFGPDDLDSLHAEAADIGYPLVVKSCRGGRGSGTRFVREPGQLEDAVRRAQAAAQAVFGSPEVYMEQAILPSHYVEVQLLCDNHGTIVHLGERDGSIQRNNQKIIEESPAPYLSQPQREHLWEAAVAIARLFDCRGACSVEFVVDRDGKPYFCEIKARIQVEHPVSELVSQIDIVREQLRIAAGEPLGFSQADVQLRGWAIQCRVNAEDPWNHFLPSPGQLRLFRLPGGPGVRVDTYAYSGCEIPARYDPVFAKLVIWGTDRTECILRTRRALEDFAISGIQTNLPLHQRIISATDFLRGEYNTEFGRRPLLKPFASEEDRRNIAVAAAIAYASRNLVARSTIPDRLLGGWHRAARQVPE